MSWASSGGGYVFGEESAHARTDGLSEGFFVFECGEHDNRDARLFVANPAGGFDAAHHRHIHIQ